MMSTCADRRYEWREARVWDVVSGGWAERFALTRDARAQSARRGTERTHLVHDVLEAVERRRRVEHEARLAAERADELERAVNVAGGLRVEGDVRRARLGEIADDAVDRRHHQVHVDGRLDTVVTQRLAHERADGEVGHVVVVHHVEVDDIRASRKHICHLLAELGEVGGEDRRRDQERALALHLHGRLGRGARERRRGRREGDGRGEERDKLHAGTPEGGWHMRTRTVSGYSRPRAQLSSSVLRRGGTIITR